MERDYRESGALLPTQPICPVCGTAILQEGERHHPAGRRKAAFLFTSILHSLCHRAVHNNPKWAEAVGMLWRGRNSKTFTYAAAVELVASWPFPQQYPLEILKQFSPD